jgi:tetratricopeptide (TPR) repeat protein
MTTNATDQGKEKMSCARVAREEILEGYLLGGLSEEDREAFEEHYFGCARCFNELQTLQSIRTELQQGNAEVPARGRPLLLRWVPIGLAAAALVAGVALWMRPALSPPSQEGANPLASSQPKPEQPRPQPPEPNVQAGSSIEQLASVEPPSYEPGTLRGPLDEATQRFQRGMERYRKGDYAKTVDELRAAQKLDPDAAHISFFLGVSHLMLGHDDTAIDALRATIALGDSPYLEDAHFYLAKAFLRRKDLDAAEAQLNQVIRLRGSESEEARRLLAGIERLKQRLD